MNVHQYQWPSGLVASRRVAEKRGFVKEDSYVLRNGARVEVAPHREDGVDELKRCVNAQDSDVDPLGHMIAPADSVRCRIVAADGAIYQNDLRFHLLPEAGSHPDLPVISVNRLGISQTFVDELTLFSLCGSVYVIDPSGHALHRWADRATQNVVLPEQMKEMRAALQKSPLRAVEQGGRITVKEGDAVKASFPTPIPTAVYTTPAR